LSMKWNKDAEKAIRKVPFFVRKRVRARVEKEARAAGRNLVSLADVKATQKRFLNNMDSEVKGYQIDSCFGSQGCPHQISSGNLPDKIEKLLKKEDLLGFLRNAVTGDLKFHHEFRVTLADCPNACSQPQIKDIGIIGAKRPYVTENECTRCMECVTICKENAITIDDTDSTPGIDFQLCVKCGDCIDVCPTGTIGAQKQGYRVLLGGKLGRHPRLARELPGIFTEQEVIDIVTRCIDYYKTNSRGGERFAELMAKDDTLFNELAR
jgi:anaerobic sulfite reductase subunit C